MSKEVKLHVGVNEDLKEIKVTIPQDAPRPWDGKDKLKQIGGRVPRIDGKAKVTGQAKYSFDVQLPGMLYGRFLRLPYPAAVVKKIDTSLAEKAPGVKAVLMVKDQLPMRVRYADQEILAIAAETPHQAEEALKLVKVDYEKRPFVVDLEEAQDPDAPDVFEGSFKKKEAVGQVESEKSGEEKQQGNVRTPQEHIVGGKLEDIEKAIKNSHAAVDATYKTQVQTHSALETHGVVAQWEKDRLTVWASTQGTFSVLAELQKSLQIPQTNIKVITDYMGGGFGSKFGAGLFGVMAARLARKAGAPVRFMLNRREEHIAGGNRPNAIQKLQMGADKNGKLTAIKLVCRGTAGIATGTGTSAPSKGVYSCEKVYTQDADVFTNASPGTAFRAPGHPQGMFALEQSIDELAYKLNMDPLEFRKVNSKHHVARMKEYDLGAKKFGWSKRNSKANADSGPIKHGVGMANSVWYYIYGLKFQVTVQVNSDGSVKVQNGVQDIGTGIRTVVGMVVAEELGLETSDIDIHIGNTDFGYGPPSGGSQTTSGITPAVRNAAYLARTKMCEIAAPILGVAANELSLGDGKIFVTKDPWKNLTWKQVASRIPGEKFTVIGERKMDHFPLNDPFIKFFGRKLMTIAGMHFADIEVDTETGVIKVKRIVAVHDCGRPMNRLTLESQINGGVIQGVSYALFENRVLDRNTGLQVNPNLEQYKIAGAMDVPQIETVILDEYTGSSSTGAKGIGEPATIPVAAAIANAFYHATGVRIRELPMTPANVLAALHG